MKLLSIALAPVLACAFYIFIRDKYEKEPFKLLFLGLFLGILISAPILKTEQFIISYMPIGGQYFDAFYNSFLSASLVEEGFKFIVLFFLIWNEINFNERFDGIVYSVFISLGFAGLENIIYIFNPQIGGFETGLSRAVFSIPAHGLFGVTMGYYFSLGKFEKNKKKYIPLAFIIPFLLHGFYDFILLSNLFYMIFPFAIIVIYMWISGFKQMKIHLDASPFKKRKI